MSDNDYFGTDPTVEKPKRKNKRDFGAATMDNRPPLRGDLLPSMLGFTEDDLDANQRGRLTRRQKERINREVKDEADSMWLMLGIFLGVSLLLALIFTMQGLPIAAMLLGAGFVVLPFMYLAYRRQHALTTDVQGDQIGTVDGYAELTMQNATRGGIFNYRMIVDKEIIKIDEDAYQRLSRYAPGYIRAYYSKRGKILLSAELLPDSEHKFKNDELLLDEDMHDIEEPEADIVLEQGQLTGQQSEKQHPLE